MKKIIFALGLSAALASVPTMAMAKAVPQHRAATCSTVNDCYYQYSIISADGGYDVYYCYSNGDGSY